MAEKTEVTKGIVTFNDWQKLDLRVAKIVEAEDIEGADKLYKLSIDLGKELGDRTLVAGLKPYYNKEELKDKLIIVFINLQPRSLRGIESQGMLLAASSNNHKQVRLLTPDKDIELGSRVS